MSVSPGRDINYREEAHIVRRSILVNAPVSRVWKALATAEGMASWLMPNDFRPVVGTRFTFTSEPEQDWDGVVECMVTELDEPWRLAFTWREAPEQAPTLVTFELHELDGKTEVCLVHSRREDLLPETPTLLDEGLACKALQRLAEVVEQVRVR
jgi:uncharacterized protein YndB with AHSA1/START domain